MQLIPYMFGKDGTSRDSLKHIVARTCPRRRNNTRGIPRPQVVNCLLSKGVLRTETACKTRKFVEKPHPSKTTGKKRHPAVRQACQLSEPGFCQRSKDSFTYLGFLEIAGDFPYFSPPFGGNRSCFPSRANLTRYMYPMGFVGLMNPTKQT